VNQQCSGTSVFYLAKFCSNAKNKNFKGIICHRFFENLKKIAKKVEVLSWFRHI
jgi:hypothetical protein